MIKAANILENPPTEAAFLLWQWLQEEPFQFEGRLYICPIEDGHKLTVYWGKPDGRTQPSITIACSGTEVRVFDSRLIPHPRVGIDSETTFNVTDPGRFEDLLAFIRWRLPPRRLPR